jgi:hypothetical protein
VLPLRPSAVDRLGHSFVCLTSFDVADAQGHR